MVVIVITAPSTTPTHANTIKSSVTFKNNDVRIVFSEQQRTDSRESTGPPSYDSGVNTDSDTKDLKIFLRDKPNGRYTFSPNSDSTGDISIELSSKDSGISHQIADNYLEYQKLKDIELLKEIHNNNIYRNSSLDDVNKHKRGHTSSSSPSIDLLTRFSPSSFQADPDNSIATTKEEEWVTKKKVELTTKRQIETRVKRQVVLEDGKVVEDSGPIVTTNTTEDTEKQEHNQTEHRTSGDDPPGEEWKAVTGPGGHVKEVKEKYVKSREETEERLETEDVQQLGNITDEGYRRAIKSGTEDVESALQVSKVDTTLVKSSPRIVYQSSKSRKTIDTQDTQESSELQPDGKLITETKTTTEHEVIDNTNIPDDKRSNGPSIEEEVKKDSSHKYRKTKEQDLTEYKVNGVKIGQKMRYQAETSEGQRLGDPSNLDQLDSLSTRIKRMRLRSQNHKIALENVTAQDRKDALTKKPLNFDQEEETRKVETSKWLEHHFGSESTRSSKGSLNDIDDVEVPPSQNSFINVTMKSTPPVVTKSTSPEVSTPESDVPKHNGYFHGISQWSSRRNEVEQEYATVKKPVKQEVSPPTPSPTYITSHTINPVQLKQTEQSTVQTFAEKYQSKEFPSPVVNHHQGSRSLGYIEQNGYPSPPNRRKYKENGYVNNNHTKSWVPVKEPEPDYPQRSTTPSPVQDVTTIDVTPNKKLYQRTRFAADIPPPPKQQQPVKQQKSKFGESFRKLVGKFRSSSNERKNKKINNKYGASSRSPSPKESTYQQYNVIDNNIPFEVGRVGSYDEEPVAPPRVNRLRPLVDCSTQTNNNMERRSIQRYYLGEDPFAGSMYGREKEYDGVTQIKSSRKRNGIIRRTNGEDLYTTTLGRLSKSTSRLTSSDMRGGDFDRGGVQTLPRKLREESRAKKQVQAQRSLGETSTNYWEQQTNKYNTKLNRTQNGGGSLINVSFVNSASPPSSNLGGTRHNGVVLNGPAKPARTYKTNLLRSKSFNVQVGDYDKVREPYKSNPQLHRLDESQEPLKSPGIISILNRSSRDVSEPVENVTQGDVKRKLFMKGLLDKAPELYKTIHGDEDERRTPTKVYTSTPLKTYNDRYQDTSRQLYKPFTNRPSFQEITTDGNTTKSIIRRGSSSNDDYSETVRISSKSDDPIRPSRTDTVQTFSKKTVPSKNGLSTETIQSSETKTVTKSRYSNNDSSLYSRSSPGGVVIEVRNTRK